MSSETSKAARLRVAIIGGGIGGLSLALALGRISECHLIEIVVFEAAPEMSQIGAGISFWPRTWEILKDLGLEHSLASGSTFSPTDMAGPVFHFRKSDQPQGVNFEEFIMNGNCFTFHRADVQKALLDNLPPTCHCRLSKRLLSYIESETEIQLEFQDGSKTHCDLLVGADGINSVVRKTFLGRLSEQNKEHGASIDPIWSGSVAYRGLIPVHLLTQQMPYHRALTTPMIYCGKNKHVVVYPVSQGRFINVVAFASEPSKEGTVFEGPTVADTTREELRSVYTGWEEEVQVLIRCIEKPSRWVIQALRPLQLYASNRMVLIGDAAHAMTPHQGAGAGQAIEDAYILAAAISNAIRTQTPVCRATRIYNTIRLPFGNRILDLSYNQGKLYEFNAPGFEEIQEGDATVPSSKLSDLITRVAKGWEWAWMSAEGDRKRALTML